MHKIAIIDKSRLFKFPLTVNNFITENLPYIEQTFSNKNLIEPFNNFVYV